MLTLLLRFYIRVEALLSAQLDAEFLMLLLKWGYDMILRRFLGVVVVANGLWACNDAKFTSAPNSGKKPNAPGSQALSCSVAPAVVNAGTRIAIQVSAGSDINGTIFQTLSGEDTVQRARLKRQGDSLVREDGSANDLIPYVNGNHTVELRLSENSQAADGYCSFAVTGGSEPGSIIGPNGYNPSPVDAPVCRDDQKSVGAQIAFIVDNSNSNAATDCPGARKTGSFQGAETYECDRETNREKAVLSSYDILAAIAAREPSNVDALSTVAVASFPTRESYTDGSQIHTNGWLNATGNTSRNNLAEAMKFARTPFGLTPYGSGLSAAKNLFSMATNDSRAKVLVFITDGEPTDRDPLAVASQAMDIRSTDVELITIFITGRETRAQRKSNHADMLRRFNEASMRDGSGTWYSNNIRGFDEYISLINGTNNVGGLVTEISSKVDERCVDQGANKCNRLTVEVSDAESLKSTLQSIIKSRAIKCE